MRMNPWLHKTHSITVDNREYLRSTSFDTISMDLAVFGDCDLGDYIELVNSETRNWTDYRVIRVRKYKKGNTDFYNVHGIKKDCSCHSQVIDMGERFEPVTRRPIKRRKLTREEKSEVREQSWFARREGLGLA